MVYNIPLVGNLRCQCRVGPRGGLNDLNMSVFKPCLNRKYLYI